MQICINAVPVFYTKKNKPLSAVNASVIGFRWRDWQMTVFLYIQMRKM